MKVFEKDIEAIDACDIFLMISPGRVGTAGTNWEQGYAYALGKELYVFQITDKATSLMTYCAATHFVNCAEDELPAIALAAVDEVLHFSSNICETVLT